MRAIERVVFHLIRLALKPVEFTRPRRYMRFYNRLLRSEGLITHGSPRFIASDARFDNPSLITVGDRLVVSRGVQFLTHDYSVTTALCAVGEMPATDHVALQEITVGRNVFIGMNALIMPGSQIGDDVIVGAGSVVRGLVPSGSIVIGNPATVVGSTVQKGRRVAEGNLQGRLHVDKR